ncbi:GTP cyclohydrolase 1 [Ananas comosus]|uniref:GTP cyclohydrolase 1 n=1 Tax=Ananas comosus TaxID=4615 RepID=A0A6P5F1P0_ANACO|nr:GTP cyclohydrolase 1 [Ananas comosus]
MGALEEGRFEGELAAAENGGAGGLGELELELGGSEPEAADCGSGSDAAAVEEAVRALLLGLGEDHEREGLRRTPHRVAKAFREGTRGYRQKVKDIVQGALFPEAGIPNGTGYAGGTGGLVIVRDIDLFSYCELCLLPFSVQCHVGYVPSANRVVGLSKLSRVADIFAKRLQDPHRLANEVCAALHSSIKPAGVAVSLQCWHIPFPENLRSSKLGMQGWVKISSSSCSGVFEEKNSSFWNDFSTILKFRGINTEKGNINCLALQPWCPLSSLEVPYSNGHSMKNTVNGKIPSKLGVTYSSMVSAVSSILLSLGEDPIRKELVGTPHRYVHWLMNFKASANPEMKLDGYNLDKLWSNHKNGEVFSNGHTTIIRSALNMPFCSQCEHHLLPFYGVVHIGYFDEQSGSGIDRARLQSLVHFYGCKLQVQERLTKQIAEAVYSIFSKGVIVVVEANHICMISRGIEKVRSSTATIAVLGQFSSDSAAKALFLETISSTSGG